MERKLTEKLDHCTRNSSVELSFSIKWWGAIRFILLFKQHRNISLNKLEIHQSLKAMIYSLHYFLNGSLFLLIMVLGSNILLIILVFKVATAKCVDSYPPVHEQRERTQSGGRDHGSIMTPVQLPLNNQLPSIHPASELTDYLPVPHGSIPRCAQDLMTICDRVENYPR